MNHRRCSVKGCPSFGIKMYSFPNANKDLKRAIEWLHAAGNEKLLDVEPNKLRQRSVCVNHFERNFILNVHLSRYAVPTLNLPEPIDASTYSTRVQNESLEGAQTEITQTVSYKELQPTDASTFSTCPVQNKSQERTLTETVQGQETVSYKEFQPTDASTFSTCPVQNKSQERALTETVQVQETVSSKELGVCNSSFGQAATRKRKDPEPSILRMLNISRKMYLTNKELQLYNTACKFKNLANRLKRRNSVLQERLHTVNTFLQHNIEQAIVDFPETVRNFFVCQVRNTNVKKVKRSYTQNDLALASAIHKRGPAAYSFLSEIFCLPTVETLRKFRNL